MLSKNLHLLAPSKYSKLLGQYFRCYPENMNIEAQPKLICEHIGIMKPYSNNNNNNNNNAVEKLALISPKQIFEVTRTILPMLSGKYEHRSTTKTHAIISKSANRCDAVASCNSSVSINPSMGGDSILVTV